MTHSAPSCHRVSSIPATDEGELERGSAGLFLDANLVTVREEENIMGWQILLHLVLGSKRLAGSASFLVPKDGEARKLKKDSVSSSPLPCSTSISVLTALKKQHAKKNKVAICRGRFC